MLREDVEKRRSPWLAGKSVEHRADKSAYAPPATLSLIEGQMRERHLLRGVRDHSYCTA
jgi:hypothetical protein